MRDATRPGLPAWAAPATCWLGYAVIGLSGNILGPILPALRHDLHAGYGALALLFVAGNVGGSVATVFGNRLLDRVGYRRLLVAGALAGGLAALARADLPSLAVWAVLSLFGGFSLSSIDIGGIRFITAAVPPKGRNAALNLLNVFYSAGSLVAPVLVGILAAAGASVMWAYALSGLATLAMGALAFVAVPSERPHSEDADLLAAWRWALGRPVLVRIGVAIALYAGLEVGFVGWIASYAHSRDHLSLAASALFPLVFWAGMTVGRTLATERARHWTEGTLVSLGTATSIVGGLIALGGGGPIPIALGVALTGIGCGPIWPSLFAVAAHSAPGRTSEAYGLLFPASSAGGLVIPWLAGQLFALDGPRAALAVPIGGAIVMAGFVAYVLARDVRALPAPTTGA